MVADASSLVEYLLRTERATPIEEVIESADTDLHVPALCDVEVTAALRRGLLMRRMTETRATQALRDYLDLPLLRHAHGALLERVLNLRKNLSAYDAIYVALAERLGAHLLTADDRLRRATERHAHIAVLPAARPTGRPAS